MVIYDQCKAIKKVFRRQQNREAARRSKMHREERFSDLYSENIALIAEHDDIARELELVNAARNAFAAAITTKLHQMAALT